MDIALGHISKNVPDPFGTEMNALTHRSRGLAIFTICSNNYVSMARILLDSAKRFHPDANIYLCLADTLLPNDGFYPDGCVVVPIEDRKYPRLPLFRISI